MKHLILGLLLLTSTLAHAGKIQNEDVKSVAELIAAGSNASHSINDTKIYVTANGINQQLSAAIASGAFANTYRVINPITFTSSGTYGVSYFFSVSSANATSGATYTNNGQTFTVINTISSGVSLLMSSTGAPLTSGTLTKATGTGDATITFAAATPPLYDIVEMVGAGGGGSGGGSGSPVTGGVGGDTLFGANNCHGGNSAGQGGNAPTGGVCSLSLGIPIMNTRGGNAGGTNAAPASQGVLGGNGGESPFRGAGTGGWSSGGNGTATIPNTGSGGGGGGGTSNAVNGCGGSAGGYLKFLLPHPIGTYSLTIGVHGAGGAAGTGGGNGSDGSDGVELITEYWQ